MSGNVPDHLLSEIKLYSNSAERDRYDSLATVYELLLAINQLERAYTRSSLSDDDYTDQCKRLLARFKAALMPVPATVRNDIKGFAEKHQLECSAALKRVEVGVPATVEFGSASDSKKNQQKHIMGATQSFVTVMDLFQLDYKEVDRIYGDISELATHLGQLDTLETDHLAKKTATKWLEVLNKMQATDELTEDQKRQAMHEFDMALTAFKRSFD